MFHRSFRSGLLCLLLVLANTLHVEAPSIALAATPIDSAHFSDAVLFKVDSPTAFAFTPDGRMLIASKNGPVRVLQNDILLPTPIIDLSAVICTERERGVVGITVDPQFAINSYMYIYYTFNRSNSCDKGGANVPVNRLSRFKLSADNKVSDERVLIDNILSTSGFHNSGDLHFGKDGYLYVSIGDGGCNYVDSSQCQDDNFASRDQFMLLGKIVRITRDGDIPADNPFQGANTARCNASGRTDAGKQCQETWAWGLRNPFRFAMDPNAATTRFFINDVGGYVREEIDLAQKAGDFGWNCREGTRVNRTVGTCAGPPANMIDPIYEYDRTTNVDGKICSSVTGGAFVPNGLWPQEYSGAYVYGDYACGALFLLKPKATSGYTSTLFVKGIGDSSTTTVQFGPYNGTQALYYANFSSGDIHRLVYTGNANQTPVANIIATPPYGAAPLTVAFDGTTSVDPDGNTPLSYAWDFGNGQTSTLDKPTTTFTTGTYYVKLVVRDNLGLASRAATLRIDSGNTPPVPTIEQPSPALRYAVGQAITLQASAIDAEDGALTDAQLKWRVLLHHNTNHTHPLVAPHIGATLTFNTPPPEDLDAMGSFLEVELTATDTNGLTSVITQNIYPNKVLVALATDPSGAILRVNGRLLTPPRTITSWEGYQLNVSAENQPKDSGSLRFDHWTDNASAARAIITPAVPITYTAVFSASDIPLPPLLCSDCQYYLPVILGFVPSATQLAAAARFNDAHWHDDTVTR